MDAGGLETVLHQMSGQALGAYLHAKATNVHNESTSYSSSDVIERVRSAAISVTTPPFPASAHAKFILASRCAAPKLHYIIQSSDDSLRESLVSMADDLIVAKLRDILSVAPAIRLLDAANPKLREPAPGGIRILCWHDEAASSFTKVELKYMKSRVFHELHARFSIDDRPFALLLAAKLDLLVFRPNPTCRDARPLQPNATSSDVFHHIVCCESCSTFYWGGRHKAANDLFAEYMSKAFIYYSKEPGFLTKDGLRPAQHTGVVGPDGFFIQLTGKVVDWRISHQGSSNRDALAKAYADKLREYQHLKTYTIIPLVSSSFGVLHTKSNAEVKIILFKLRLAVRNDFFRDLHFCMMSWMASAIDLWFCRTLPPISIP
jgi:hypothetical protein